MMRLLAGASRRLAVRLACAGAVVLAGCSVAPPKPEPAAPAQAGLPPLRADQLLARDERFAVYLPAAGETLAMVARRFLGDEGRAWMIADFNGITQVQPGWPVVVPLQPFNPTGVSIDGYQTVPILCYHRFGAGGGKMVVAPDAFAAQMDYLARSGYRVIRLSELEEFLQGRRQLPRRAVVITIDDGYAGTYNVALPILKKHGFPATLFLYSDFVGARDALTWPQMRELVESGLFDIQAHSKTHANLSLRLPGESDERYRERIDEELRVPQRAIKGRLSEPVSSFAYPYGDTNETVMERLMRADYRLAVTVNPGGNPFFSHPLLLRRTMIYGDHDLEAFKARLQVFRDLDLR
jgi:peptidoglycan/xylan/chitin deacetylase (PgdA/CDA1 family)